MTKCCPDIDIKIEICERRLIVRLLGWDNGPFTIAEDSISLKEIDNAIKNSQWSDKVLRTL